MQAIKRLLFYASYVNNNYSKKLEKNILVKPIISYTIFRMGKKCLLVIVIVSVSVHSLFSNCVTVTMLTQ